MKNVGTIFTNTSAGTSAPNPPYFANMCCDLNQMFSLTAGNTIGFTTQTDGPANTNTCYVNIEKVNF